MWATWTALGSPLVPEVKISMKVSVGATSRCGLSSGAWEFNFAHCAESTSKTVTPGSSRLLISSRWSLSVSRI